MRFIILLLSLVSFSADAEILTWDCDYQTWSDETGTHKSNGEMRMKLTYDLETKAGYMEGNNGTVKVREVVVGQDAMTFIFVGLNGSINITTIYAKSLTATHSRHTVISNTSLSSQYYGSCSVI